MAAYYLLRDKRWLALVVFAVINFLSELRGMTLWMVTTDAVASGRYEQIWIIAKQIFAGPLVLQDAAIFAALPMALYNGKKGKDVKWFFYGFCPLHLIVLSIINMLN